MVQYEGNKLMMNNLEFDFEQPIKQILEFSEIIIVLLDNEEMPNNIIAYSKQGIEIWRINDILKITEIGNFTEIEKVSDNVLGAYYIWGIYYEIDIKKRITLRKEYIR